MKNRYNAYLYLIMISMLQLLLLACESQSHKKNALDQASKAIEDGQLDHSLQAKNDQASLTDQLLFDLSQLIDQSLTSLDQSNLDQSNLDQSNLDQSNLDQSNLDQSNLDQSNLDQSNLDRDQVLNPMDTWLISNDMAEADVYLPEEEALAPCDPPLTAQLEHQKLPPLGLNRIYAQGGSGHYELRLLEDASQGAQVSSRPLSYLAGRQGGVRDILAVTDLQCSDQVTLSVHILESLSVMPRTSMLPPHACLKLTANGGSGHYQYQVLSAQALGQIDEQGNYQSLGMVGDELIRLLDQETGERLDIRLKITEDASLDLGGDLLFMLEGSKLALSLNLGDHQPLLNSDHPNVVAVINGELTAIAPGEANITVRQPAIGCLGPNRDQLAQASAKVKVLSPVPTDIPASFVGSRHRSHAKGLGDLNGDGVEDFILTDGGAHFDARYSGGGALYLSQNGYEYQRSLEWAGKESNGRWGDAIATADFNQDGLLDLAVGAAEERFTGVGTGLVYLYFQKSDRSFNSKADRVLSGLTGDFNEFGTALASCDFNQDGRMDLAISAPKGISSDPYLVFRGYVSIFYGEEQGLSPVPRQMLWGLVPDAGQWKGLSFMLFGSQLAVGDFDGNGVCDLAVQANQQPQARDSANQGYLVDYTAGSIMIYEGRAGTGLGGTPKLHIIRRQNEAGFSGNNRFGAHMALADLNGDQKAELITSYGIFRGRDFPNQPQLTPLSEEAREWSFNTIQSYPIDVIDINEDGHLDVVIGDQGIKVFLGDLNEAIGLSPSFQNAYSFRTGGNTPAEHASLPIFRPDIGGGSLGISFLYLGNQHFLLSDHTGPSYQLGAHWIWDGQQFNRIPFPYRISDGRVGQSVALSDLNGDQQAELIVGAPGIWAGNQGYRYTKADAGDEFLGGGAMIYFQPPQATSINGHELSIPQSLLDPYRGYWVRFGERVSGISDFNGDGIGDLAVINPDLGLPNPSSTAWPFVRCQVDAPQWIDGAWRCPDPSQENRWSGPIEALYDVPPECQISADNTGMVDIYIGRSQEAWQIPSEAGGLGPRPSISLFGPTAQAYWGAGKSGIEGGDHIASDFDFNGDQLMDIAVGAPNAEANHKRGAGFVSLYFGQSDLTPQKTKVRCRPDLTILGSSMGGNLGWAVEGIKDLNGDQCDELLISAPAAPERDPWNPSWAGRVFLLLGHGPQCASLEAQVLALSIGLYTGSFGWAISSANWMDDQSPSIAISAPYALANQIRRGVVTALSRTMLIDLLNDGMLSPMPIEGLGQSPSPIEIPVRFDSNTAIWGESTQERISIDAIYSVMGTAYDSADRFGSSLTWVPKGQDGVLAIGIPRKDFGNAMDAGEATLWDWQSNGFKQVARVIGQTQKPGSAFSSSLVGGKFSHRSMLVIGAPMADADTQANVVENGAVYLVDLEELEVLP